MKNEAGTKRKKFCTNIRETCPIICEVQRIYSLLSLHKLGRFYVLSVARHKRSMEIKRR